MKQHRLIMVIAVGVIALNACLLHLYPVAKIVGDEPRYVKLCHQDSSTLQKLSRLLPGNMCFEWQPPFPYSVFGLLATDQKLFQAYQNNEAIQFNPGENERVALFLHKVSWLNIALFLILGINVYRLGLLLGFGKASAVLTSCFVWFNPAMIFYVSTMWPEFLHLALLSSAFLLLLLFDARKKLRFLSLSGILFGFCALTKGIVGWYLLCLLPVIAYFSFSRSSDSLPLRARIQSGLKIMAIFFGCYAAVVYPQKAANYYKHHVFAISTNTWINVESAVIPYEEPVDETFHRYLKSSPDLRSRENLSRERVLEYLKRPTVNVSRILSHQLDQFVSQQLNGSFLVRSYGEQRWGDKIKAFPYGTIAINMGLVISWILFLFGLQGVIRNGAGSFGSAVLAIYVLYYCLSLLVVGWNPRFFIQAMPFLAIFASSVLLRFRKDPGAAGKESRESSQKRSSPQGRI